MPTQCQSEHVLTSLAYKLSKQCVSNMHKAAQAHVHALSLLICRINCKNSIGFVNRHTRKHLGDQGTRGNAERHTHTHTYMHTHRTHSAGRRKYQVFFAVTRNVLEGKGQTGQVVSELSCNFGNSQFSEKFSGQTSGNTYLEWR